MAKKKNKQFPRQNHIAAGKKPTVKLGEEIQFHRKNGQVTITDSTGKPLDFGTYSMTRTYRGEHKTRVVAKAAGLSYVTDQVGAWVVNFDEIFAIDTNTHPEKVDDAYCSAGMVYHGVRQKTSDYEGVLMCSPYLMIDWYHSGIFNMEPLTWMEAIKVIQTKIPADKKVAIVVDSELGNLDGYNNRTIPIYQDWYLPENYTLIFASADYRDEWCNQMIKQCDKAATQRLQEILRDPKFTTRSEGCVAPIGMISLFV